MKALILCAPKAVDFEFDLGVAVCVVGIGSLESARIFAKEVLNSTHDLECLCTDFGII